MQFGGLALVLESWLGKNPNHVGGKRAPEPGLIVVVADSSHGACGAIASASLIAF